MKSNFKQWITIQIDQLIQYNKLYKLCTLYKLYNMQLYNKYDNKWFDDKNGFELTIWINYDNYCKGIIL